MHLSPLICHKHGEKMLSLCYVLWPRPWNTDSWSTLNSTIGEFKCEIFWNFEGLVSLCYLYHPAFHNSFLVWLMQLCWHTRLFRGQKASKNWFILQYSVLLLSWVLLVCGLLWSSTMIRALTTFTVYTHGWA